MERIGGFGIYRSQGESSYNPCDLSKSTSMATIFTQTLVSYYMHNALQGIKKLSLLDRRPL